MQSARRVWMTAFLAAMFTGSLAAQEFRGAILGRITDTSGAVVPGAAVKATNEETNVAVETKSNAEGNYTIPYLIPGVTPSPRPARASAGRSSRASWCRSTTASS